MDKGKSEPGGLIKTSRYSQSCLGMKKGALLSRERDSESRNLIGVCAGEGGVGWLLAGKPLEIKGDGSKFMFQINV